MFLRFTVRCAAYAAWTTPGLAQTDKTCVKLTCLLPGTGFIQEYKHKLYQCRRVYYSKDAALPLINAPVRSAHQVAHGAAHVISHSVHLQDDEARRHWS